MSKTLSVTLPDIKSAAEAINGVAVRTPLLENADLNERCGRRILIKFEGAQHTGAFKFRGAFNKLAQLDKASGEVVAWSGGNHAQGVALAAKHLGVHAVIVMPSDAPRLKIENTHALGAEIILYDRHTENREEIAKRLAAERGATLVPSYDDPFVIAGQGTIGLEILEQAHAAGAKITQMLIGCGGGGQIAGIATAVKAHLPEVDIYAVEPKGFDDVTRSLRSGRREKIEAGGSSICDALLAPSPGVLTFPIIKALVSGGLLVSDSDVRAAMRYAFSTLKLVTEPGAVVALAALLTDQVPKTHGDTAIVISGANVDMVQFTEILQTDD